MILRICKRGHLITADNHASNRGCLTCRRAYNKQWRNRQTPAWHAYWSAKQRCTDPNHKSFKNYGAVGVKFLFTSIAQWLAELGPQPSSRHTVDRPDPLGNYEPGNIRWATPKEQRINQRAEARIMELEKQLAACRSQHAN